MVKTEYVDIFKSPAEIIIHQANCFCTMRSGIANEIRLIYPRAYEADKMTEKGAISKLGQFSFAQASEDQDRTIINLYSQFKYGKDGVQYTDYKAMTRGLTNIRDFVLKMGWQNKIVGIPHNLGCGHGGGNWDIVEEIIKIIFGGSSIQILICKI